MLSHKLFSYLVILMILFGFISPSAALATTDPLPVCSFTGPSQLSIGEQGTFTSTSTGSVTSKIWSTTKGNPLSGVNIVFHWTPTAYGTATITLTLFGPNGNAACSADVITIAPTATPTSVPTATPKPTATPTPKPSAAKFTNCSFSVSPATGTYTVGQVLTFRSTSTSSGNIGSTVWQASGGSALTGLASTFLWSASTPGTYTIKLTVTGVDGTSACNANASIVQLATASPSPTPGVSTSPNPTSSPSPTTFTPVVPMGGPVTGKAFPGTMDLRSIFNL